MCHLATPIDHFRRYLLALLSTGMALRELNDKMLCYCKDDRAMRPIYKLFHPNFVHAYGHNTLRGFDSERI